MLVENEKVVSKSEEIKFLFNTYFKDITKGLNIDRWQCSNLPCKDPLVNAIRKCEMDLSILKIKLVFTSIRLFDFNFVSSDEISKIITSSDSTKKTIGVFPREIVKLANKEICKDLASCINESIKKNELPSELKAADITSIFKKEDPLNKENFRPVSVLPTISSIFEKVLFEQLAKFSNKFLSPLLRGFRKGYSI